MLNLDIEVKVKKKYPNFPNEEYLNFVFYTVMIF